MSADANEFEELDASRRLAFRTAKRRHEFLTNRERLTSELFDVLDSRVTKGEVAKRADVHIEWSKTPGDDPSNAGWTAPEAMTEDGRLRVRITLNQDRVDDEGRLNATLAHEFCHVAVKVMEKEPQRGHDTQWRSWADKCEQHMTDYGIKIDTEHEYAPKFRFIWTCPKCHREMGFHRDHETRQCWCKATMVQTNPVARAKRDGAHWMKG